MVNADYHAFEQYEELYKAIEKSKDIHRIPKEERSSSSSIILSRRAKATELDLTTC
jgi:hypothetical protein